MGRTIFIKEIVAAATEPGTCPNCGKGDRLEANLVREERSCGRTILCSRCEALILITHMNLRQVELYSEDNTIMLKEPYVIRRIGY